MLKRSLALVLFGLFSSAYAQMTPVASIGASSDGLVQIADINCGGSPCAEDSDSFILPFSIEVEGTNTVSINNMEIYLAQIIRSEFDDKLKAYRYAGGVKFFGVQSSEFGVNEISNRLLSINIISTDFVSEVALSQDGRKRLIFQVHGTFGMAKAKRDNNVLSAEDMQIIQDELDLVPESPVISNKFGTKTNIYASIKFEMNKLRIGAYGIIDYAKTNNIMGGTADINGMKTSNIYTTKSLGLELEYDLKFKRSGNLSVFAGVELNSYKNGWDVANTNGETNRHLVLKPQATNELLFKAGIRYNLSNFKFTKRSRH